jgi:hypothetical protein
MIPTRLLDSSIEEVNSRAGFIIGACGYETRSTAIVDKLAESIRSRHAIAFEEHPEELARLKNEEKYKFHHFDLKIDKGGSTRQIEQVVRQGIWESQETGCALAFDISSMTRAWHGGIIRTLMERNQKQEIETFFLYVPGKYSPPPDQNAPNEVVGPVEGFSSLSPPDLPIALIMSLGYERHRALGFMEILDPGRTVLMLANMEEQFYQSVLANNREVIARTPAQWLFDYPLREPSATFRILESICGGLEPSYRIVLASLGPKIFGILCFLLAAKNRAISVWRMSSGVHGRPRDVMPDQDRLVVLKAVWTPELDEVSERIIDTDTLALATSTS